LPLGWRSSLALPSRRGATTVEPTPGGLESAAGGTPRFPCFDGLRTIAAMSVLVHHVAGTSGAVTGTVAGYAYAHLDAGVTVFFVISGFLLYRPFAAAHLGDRPAPRTVPFYRRRFWRIFPAYWAALLVVWLVFDTIAVADAESFLRYFTLTHVYSKDHVLGGIIPTWSLATEIAFYLALPLYAAVLGALTRRSRRPHAVELTGVAVLYAIGIGTHAALVYSHDAATPATLWLPAQVDLFALGMLLAVLHTMGVGAAIGRRAGVCWALAGVAFWTVSTQLDLPRVFADLTDRGELGRQVLYAATAVLLVAPGVFGDQRAGAIRRFLSSRAMVAVGIVSYGVFLWHFDLMKLFDDWYPDATFPALLAAVAAAAVAVATLSWLVVEKPLQSLSRRAR
jgi:peptidoglycan/LPS O-acetylase OafA/YrhL